MVKEMIGYKGECDETNFSERNIVTLPVRKIIIIREQQTARNTSQILIDSRYKSLKLSSVSNSLCFKFKLKLSQ